MAGKEAERIVGLRGLDEQLVRDQAALLEVKKDMEEAEEILRQKMASIHASIKAVYDVSYLQPLRPLTSTDRFRRCKSSMIRKPR